MGLGSKQKWLARQQWHGELTFRREGGQLFVRMDVPQGALWLQVPPAAVPLVGWP